MSVERARTLRKNMPEPERVLWRELRARGMNAKFRRQHPVGPYVLDFYAPSASLAIEVDGDSHFESSIAQTHDATRTAFLTERGIRILRFTNRDVMASIEGVCATIADGLRLRPNTSPPRAPPPPEVGRRGNCAMVILGLDPGVARLGYGVIESDGRRDRCVTYGVLTTPKGELGPRFIVLRRELLALIAAHQPQRIVIEQLFFSKNVKTATAVGEARGVILLTCAESGLPTIEVSPQAVKQAVAGYGAADKQQVQRMVRTLLQLDAVPQPDDAADALAVALCGVRMAVAQ